MPTVVAIYTGQGLADPIKALFAEMLPQVRLVNIIDDGLIHDLVKEGVLSKKITRRLVDYYRQAVDMGADVILNTCSSVGEVVVQARPLFEVPIVRIDEPMARDAVATYRSVGVIATLPSTLAPTMRLLEEEARAAGTTVQITAGLAEGAFDALISGHPQEHDRLIMETALRLAPSCDAIVLAQGSMARMETALVERTGKPVLSSPRRGVAAVKRVLSIVAASKAS